MDVRKLILGTLIAGSTMATGVGMAFADGNGYAPASGSGTTGSTGSFPTVLNAKTVSSSGATLNARVNSITATVSIPSGAFTTPEQVTLTSGDTASLASTAPSGDEVVAAFGVNFSGAAPTKPITLTISSPSIPAGGQVYKVTGTGLVLENATVTNGQAIVSFSTDPNFIVVSPKLQTVPGATSPVTGIPILDEVIAGLILVAIGGYIAYSARKKAL